MEMADKFNLPVITLVDTAGAYPGIGAEERGQAEAIARSTDQCLAVGVPIIAVVIGEGGSGGAVAMATANRILMLEHSIYTVASPEAAASILGATWRSDRCRDQYEDYGTGSRDARGHRRHRPRAGRRGSPDRGQAIEAAGDAIALALAEFEGKSPIFVRIFKEEIRTGGLEGARRRQATLQAYPICDW